MTYCGSKNDFCKKSGCLLLSAEVQNHPGSNEIGRNLHKIQKNTSEGCRNKMRADMCILGGLVFMLGVFPNFRFRILVAASQKTRFRYSENGKSTFRGTKRKSASVAFLAIPMATRVSDMALF
jgi:hypothetical protein